MGASALMLKNVTFFSLLPGLDLADLERQLSQLQFQPCGASDADSVGWVETVAGEGLVGCQIDGQAIVTLQVETKRIPGSALKTEVAKRVAALTESQGFSPGRKQVKELKEAVTDELLARVLSSTKRVPVWIDVKGGWLAVDAGAGSVVDVVMRSFSRSLDAFPCVAVKTAMSPVGAMTLWLSEDADPAGFTVDMDCGLKGPEGQTVRFSKHCLSGQVQQHLKEGKTPVSLGLTFDSRVSFVLTETMALKKLNFVDTVLNGHKENNASSESAKAAALGDLAFIGGELRRLLPALLEALGGAVVEAAPEQLKAA